ncbi:hypothetical protein EUA04_26595 [Mycolicibacterium obuense]|uniref:Uncharacterized protein n=1 Tax=Mycolicibacterium obuense TaxID=1807 RepID=A0A0J6W0P9_9MYCO|nr:hypothetical protein [Mycolicibacterium obuense]KKF01990.1 hypothetical protein WN67_10725 [Mycolicibacterium obuense]KMO75969.1 hypothetical protein MOBUDSM44075_02499 [Mycolicibacterium obuense]TDL02995.1 hypothetical protein EUA04_26595 [Mycolicibacterium obuense]
MAAASPSDATYRAGLGFLLVLALCSAGCSGRPSSEPETVTDSAPPAALSVARVVVDRLQSEDHVVLNPVDTTGTDCPSAGCAQAVTTDRFEIMSFPGTGVAQRYAADRGLRQIASLVVDFAPTVPEAERDQLWADVTRMVD